MGVQLKLTLKVSCTPKVDGLLPNSVDPARKLELYFDKKKKNT